MMYIYCHKLQSKNLNSCSSLLGFLFESLTKVGVDTLSQFLLNKSYKAAIFTWGPLIVEVTNKVNVHDYQHYACSIPYCTFNTKFQRGNLGKTPHTKNWQIAFFTVITSYIYMQLYKSSAGPQQGLHNWSGQV